ncbi:metallophosphoesterase [Mucilaginibacter lappiensis]|uniref:metallophosphoesterase n=1 Tax=Mucilaginibacter lappiensis TaxID=354630 RepID=UPI003D1958E4
MKKRIPAIVLLWLIIDIYFFTAVETLTHDISLYLAYWLFDALLAGTILYSVITGKTKLVSWLMALMLLSFIPKLVGSIVLMLEDITRLFRGFPPRSYGVSEFVLVVAGTLFLLLLFGITRGRHYYKVRRETLYFDDLPETFDGFTITQLSDIHSGSFSDRQGVQKGLDLVNAQGSDVILFTGDLVNNQATEMDPWIPAFAELEAPYGKYSVLGNHDYGDYMQWENKAAQYDNLNRLKQVHKEIGFQLLLNESMQIQKDDQSVALIGVENWGKGGFHKYGDLEKAAANVPDGAFRILMSHDPSHWDAVTVDHHQHIHLTLSGHTHGMQFGFELFGFKWSPIRYIYKQWAGLYQKSGQYLYVNRGFGFLGLKGRVGIWPEIAVITLKRKSLV